MDAELAIPRGLAIHPLSWIVPPNPPNYTLDDRDSSYQDKKHP